MKKLLAASLLSLTAFAAPTGVYAQQSGLPGLPVKLGDEVQTVKASLNTALDPEPIERSPALPAGAVDVNKGKSVLHLRTKGIWVFFNPAGKAETIRLDAPYSGNVKGIKIGDTSQKLISTLGQPIKKPWTVFLTLQAYQYVLDDTAYVNFNVGDDGVQYIFVTR
jgi:hypothetical protein